MSKKIRYDIRYRDSNGTLTTTSVEAESESEAIQQIKRLHPRATEIVAKPR